MTADLQRGISDRLRQVLALGRVENASQWALAAKLNRTFVTAFMERVRKGTVGDIGVLNLLALAQVARVSPAWLAYGVGNPDDDLPPLLGFPPNLLALLKRLPPNTYPDPLVRQAAMVLEVIGEKDMPEDAWQDYLDGIRREARRMGLELAASRLEQRGVTR